MRETIVNVLKGIPFSEFNFYSDGTFWLYFLGIVFLFGVIRGCASLNNVALLLINAAMLLALPRFNVNALFVYFGLAALTFGIGRYLAGGPRAPAVRRFWTGLGIGISLFTLGVFKYRLIQSLVLEDKSIFGEGSGNFVFLIGISYVSFKAIHFLVETYKGSVAKPELITYFNYLLFFPAFVSGPINRYNDFLASAESAARSRIKDDLWPGFERILHGLFKKFVLTALLFPFTVAHLKTPLVELQWWQVLFALYCYALYFYFDFAAYTDFAIGSARLLGYSLPENFNRPFLKKNIQQLWANWHISLTSWLTDYVYWPLVRRIRASDFLRKYPLLISNVSIIVTFFLCGAWHGEGINFILWGIYHGIGIAIVNFYQKWKRQVRDPRALRYFASNLSYGLGVFLTFNFFSLGLLFLLERKQLSAVFGRFF